MSDPYQRIRLEAEEFVANELQSIREDSLGDSPIEKLFFTALSSLIRFGMSEYKHLLVPTSQNEIARALQSQDPLTMIVLPQAQLEGWRVDFLIRVMDLGRVSGRPQWRCLIVECDGHDFHERTKEQAAKDRSRDRDWQIKGFGVLRFTGSELHRDPLKCAREVSDWGIMGW